MIVIGITGTLGAGKGTIVDFLVTEKKFQHYSVRAYLVETLKQQGMPVNRDTMTALANQLRADHTPSYITDQLYEQAIQSHDHVIIESIRTPGEIISLREKGHFILFAVDADMRTRYERIKLRKSETDHISWETFQENEQREMTSEDPHKQNLQQCIEMADYVFENNGNIEELYASINQILKEIL